MPEKNLVVQIICFCYKEKKERLKKRKTKSNSEKTFRSDFPQLFFKPSQKTRDGVVWEGFSLYTSTTLPESSGSGFCGSFFFRHTQAVDCTDNILFQE